MKTITCVGLVLASLVIFGCGSDSAPNRKVTIVEPGKPQREEAISAEVEQAIEDVAQQQSTGMANASAQIHRAYIYNDRDRYFIETPDSSMQLVAVEVTLRNYSSGFDLDDIDILDAEGENYGSDPALYGVLADGQLADIDDEGVRHEKNSLRVLLVYYVPIKVKAIQLAYWSRNITIGTTALTNAGPVIPSDRIVFAKGLAVGKTVRDDDQYLVFLKVQNMPRGVASRYYFIRCSGTDTLGLARSIEVDESMRIPKLTRTLPPFVPQRFFLLEFVLKAGCTPNALSTIGINQPIEALTKLPPPETLQALYNIKMQP